MKGVSQIQKLISRPEQLSVSIDARPRPVLGELLTASAILLPPAADPATGRTQWGICEPVAGGMLMITEMRAMTFCCVPCLVQLVFQCNEVLARLRRRGPGSPAVSELAEEVPPVIRPVGEPGPAWRCSRQRPGSSRRQGSRLLPGDSSRTRAGPKIAYLHAHVKFD